jgi:hypothetical protein
MATRKASAAPARTSVHPADDPTTGNDARVLARRVHAIQLGAAIMIAVARLVLEARR